MAKRVADLIRERLGVAFYEVENPEISSVGTTALTVFRANPNRAALLLVNLSVNNVFAAVRGTPSSTNGIRLGPSGGSLILWWEDDATLPTREWRVVADAAGSTLYSLEILILGEHEGA